MATDASVVRDEKRAEADYQKEKKEAAKHSFSMSVSGTKEVATAQVGDQMADSPLASAIKALVAAAPGNMLSLAGSMDASEDGKTGHLTITGIFKTLPEEVIKAHAKADADATKARETAAAESDKAAKKK